MCINILYPKVMIVLSVLVFLIDLESVENLLNVMDLQKVNVTRENVMHLAKKKAWRISQQHDVSPKQGKKTHKTR